MSALDVLRLAAGAILKHRLRTGLCLLGLAIGVAAVVILTALGEGARAYVGGQFESLGSSAARIHLPMVACDSPASCPRRDFDVPSSLQSRSMRSGNQWAM